MQETVGIRTQKYRGYFFQSQAHNVVLFNGKGQSKEQQYHGSSLRGYLYHLMDAGDAKLISWRMVRDLTPTSSVVTSVVFLMVGQCHLCH